jgi:hypothetical protein
MQAGFAIVLLVAAALYALAALTVPRVRVAASASTT